MLFENRILRFRTTLDGCILLFTYSFYVCLYPETIHCAVFFATILIQFCHRIIKNEIIILCVKEYYIEKFVKLK